jgi:hypothetical protein
MKDKHIKVDEVKASLTLSGMRYFKNGIHSENNNTKISVDWFTFHLRVCERYMEHVDRG